MMTRKIRLFYFLIILSFLGNLIAEFDQEKRPKVGVSVFIVKDGKILLGLRKNSHGAGTWAPPGGHLEHGESFESCAQREVLEEVGLTLSNLRMYTVTNDIFEEEEKHYVTIFMVTDQVEGQVQLLEPEKCECWVWFDPNTLPTNLFLPLKNLFGIHQQIEGRE